MNWERLIWIISISILTLLLLTLAIFGTSNNQLEEERDKAIELNGELIVQRDYYKKQYNTTCNGLNVAIDIIHLYNKDSPVKYWDCKEALVY